MKISLITVSYNSAATIRSTLDSVAAQCYPNLEYIIVDGGSTDETLEIIESYKDLITICISEPDKGIYDAMNKGVQNSTGDVVCILNSDDFYLGNQVLHDVGRVFATDSDLDVVLGDVDFVSDCDLSHPIRRYSSRNFKPWMFRFGLMPPHPATFVRKSAYNRIGLYKTAYKIAADFDFLIRLLLVDGAKYLIVQKKWVRMRTGGVSTSGFKSNFISTREMKRALRENSFFASSLMLMCRLPFKLFVQVFRK